MKRDIDSITEKVKNSKVIVTKEEIEDYLAKKFQEERPELKSLGESGEDAETVAIFEDELTRYEFFPFTLTWYQEFIRIAREKSLLLLGIIDSIVSYNAPSISDILTSLDIVLDQNGNITKNDIIRLLMATIQNITMLEQRLIEANDFENYLLYKLSSYDAQKLELTKEDLYPDPELQSNVYRYGNVPFSVNQELEASTRARLK